MTKEKFTYDGEFYQNFLCYSFKNIKTKQFHRFTIFADLQNTANSINDFGPLMQFTEQQCQWLVGFNSIGYDDLLLMYMQLHKVRLRTSSPRIICKELWELSNRIINAQRDKSHLTEVIAIRKIKKIFRSLDLLLLYNPVDRTSLKQLAVGLKWPVLEDLPYPPSHIVLYSNIERIKHYNDNDVNITEKLMYHLSEKINHRIAFTKKFGVNILNSCNADIARKLIAHYYTKETGRPYEDYRRKATTYERIPMSHCISPRIHFETPYYQKLVTRISKVSINPDALDDIISRTVWNPYKKKFIKPRDKQFEAVIRSKYVKHTMGLGGVHSDGPAEILVENDQYAYIDIDARSFYPFIIIYDNLYPKHLGPEFVPVYKKYIVEERMKVVNTDAILAYMLKIAANATFGMTKAGYTGNWLYDPHVALSICISGQLYLFMLMEAIEKYSRGIVVYSNTDGLTIRIPRNEIRLLMDICKRWESRTGFQLEYNYYTRMIMRDVNNFIMFSENKDPEKQIKAKGAYVYDREEYKGYHYPIVAKSIQDYFMKNKPFEETIMESRDVYDFMASQKTSIAKFEVKLFPRINPTMPIILQKTNRWVVTKGSQEEGKLYKVNRKTAKKTDMQTERTVTILNDVNGKAIEDYYIDFDFYIEEAKRTINLTQVLNKETHIKPEFTQLKLELA